MSYEIILVILHLVNGRLCVSQSILVGSNSFKLHFMGFTNTKIVSKHCMLMSVLCVWSSIFIYLTVWTRMFYRITFLTILYNTAFCFFLNYALIDNSDSQLPCKNYITNTTLQYFNFIMAVTFPQNVLLTEKLWEINDLTSQYPAISNVNSTIFLSPILLRGDYHKSLP